MIKKIISHLYDKTGVFKLAILTSPLFILGLVGKLYAAAIFSAENFTTLFVPFLKYFSLSGLQDPYSYFYNLGTIQVFPYPQLMLYVMSLPGLLLHALLQTDIFSISHGELLLYHLPIIVADITILIVLSRWLKNKQRELLIFYWLSPILIYINYIHSQLDAIPIALTFVFLYFLFKERWIIALAFLGAAIATKFHIIILLPFTIIYLWRKRILTPLIALYTGATVGIFLLINNIQLFSSTFFTIVFANREQGKVFDLQIPLGGEHIIYITPLAYTLLFLHALTFKRLNRDTFVMFIGFSFGILILTIPPIQGWYYWIIPFFLYFYIKNERHSKLPLIVLTLTYFIYFALTPNSDYLKVLSFIAPNLAALPNLYTLLISYGFNAELISNLALSVLQATLLVNVFWIYRRGIEESKKQKLYSMPYLIGLAGDSGSGKSTLASLLNDLFSQKHTALVAGDAMHKWERGDAMWQKFTHLDPRANQLHGDLEYALALQEGEDVYRRQYDHHVGKFTAPEKLESKTLVIFEGLHSFFLTHMQKALDLKVFIRPEEQLRTHWKLKRDMLERGYTRAKVLSQLQSRKKDAEEYVTIQEKYADITFSLKSLASLTDDVIGTDFEPAVYLEIRCNNTVYLDPLLESLATYVNIEHTFTDQHQILSFSGTISDSVIEHLSFSLAPELYDVVSNTPKWSRDHSGIMQLFTCYYILESLHYNNRTHSPQKNIHEGTPLTDIAKVAKELGGHKTYVQGGGGNVSVKIDSTTMAVKASGLRLAELEDTAGFVGINFNNMRRFFNTPRPTEALLDSISAYEATIANSRTKIPNIPNTTLRPSIETGFHAILDTAVIHTHSVYVNILTCSVEGRKILNELYPEAAYIPYYTPGVPLTFAISNALKTQPYDTFFLENHGIIVTGKTVDDTIRKHREVNHRIKKWLRTNPPFPDTNISTQPNGSLISSEESLKNFIKEHAGLLASFNEIILFPDQVVYCKKFGFEKENKPITIDLSTGIITYKVSFKEAQAFVETLVAWVYILKGINQHKLTYRTLPVAEGDLIANLDSEKYRQRLIQ